MASTPTAPTTTAPTPWRVGWYVHHRGAGHAMTAGAVIPLLDADVTVFTSSEHPVVAPNARTVRLPLDTDTDTGTDTGTDTRTADSLAPAGGGRTAHGLLHWAPTDSAGHTGRLAAIAAWVAETRPHVFVVDVSAEVAAFVRLLGVPVVTFTLPGHRDDPAHRLAYGLSDAVVAPWPAGLGPAADSVPVGRLHPVGALSRFAPVEAPARTVSGAVVVLHGAGGRGDDPLDAAAARLGAAGVAIAHLRDADANEVWARLCAASVVLSHCGASAVAEIAAARRPALLIPDARPHDEQRHLAEALTRAGMPLRIVAPDAVAQVDWADEHHRATLLDGADWRRWNDGGAATRIASLVTAVAAGTSAQSFASAPSPASAPASTTASARTAVITVVAGRRKHLARQEEWLARAPERDVLRVLVLMDDQPVNAPGAHLVRLPNRTGALPLPLAAARNAGAQAAIAAGADVLVFLDVDCLPRPGLLEAYRVAAQERPDALLTGAVGYLPDGVDYDRPETFDAAATVHDFRPSPAPGILEPARHELFWSLSFACTRAVWNRIGGFDEGYSGYGGEDTDFGRLARDAGVELLFVGGARADHQFHPVSDPPVEHLDDILRNAARYRRKWGSHPMQGWLDDFHSRGLIAHDPLTDTYSRTDAA